ncbi:MAG: M48 family metallopeptidase [Leptothrix ochracea]|uniref:M48 family metallopeptidase n=1 Tax=Leptothrix ochracea TaxID=735331 RepID=UPI0034E1E936
MPQIRLGEHTLSYQLHRVQRRSIGLVIRKEGLAVRAPAWVALSDIEAALRQKADWILQRLAEQEHRNQAPHPAPITWQHGTVLPYLGDSLQLDVTGKGPRPELIEVLPETSQASPSLHLRLKAQDADHLRAAVHRWWKQAALRLFAERIALYAPRLALHALPQLHLTSARTRWGSASKRGALQTVRLNWRLLHLPIHLIDYVVVHELAHLHEMNHSPAFWRHVEAVLPDTSRRRAELKRHTVPEWGA